MRSLPHWSVDVAAVDRARILRGWTRRDLGRRALVGEGTLCDMFARRRTPSFGTLRALCLALDLALESVIAFERSDSEPSVQNGTPVNNRDVE
jgi:transcriptional regulator with XRE-family HTH domain